MADVITSDQSIADLLSEQKTTSQHLAMFKDTNEYMQDMILEQMQTNENLDAFNAGMKQFSNVIMVGMKALSDKISTINDQTNPLEVIDVSPAKPALLPPPVTPEVIIDKDMMPVPAGQPASTPITFEGGEVVPVVETAAQYLGQTLKNDAIMINSLGQLVEYQNKMVKMAEAAEDVGTVNIPTAGSPDDKDDETSSGAIGGMFKGFGKKLGKKFPILGKVGKGALNAAKFLGPIAAAAMATVDFAQGVQNAPDIIGKPMEELDSLEKAGAGIASVVSGLTFGLIDAKDAYSGIETMSSTISGIGKDLFNMMPDSVQKGLSGAFDFLFDEKEGIFGSIQTQFSDFINSLSQGNWGDALLSLVTSNIRLVFGSEGFIARGLGKAWDGIKSAAGAIFDMMPTGVQTKVTEFSDWVMGKVDSVTNMFNEYFGGFIDMMSEKIMALVDSVVDMIPKSVKDFGGKVANFFGFGDDEKPKASETVAKIESPTDKQRQATRDELAKKYGVKDASSGAAIVEQARLKNKEEIARRNRFDSSVAPSRNKGVSAKVDTKDTVALSKSRMEDSGRAPQSQPQPIVIQQPAEKPKKTMSRELSIGDTELAMMNANMLDG